MKMREEQPEQTFMKLEEAKTTERRMQGKIRRPGKRRRRSPSPQKEMISMRQNHRMRSRRRSLRKVKDAVRR